MTEPPARQLVLIAEDEALASMALRAQVEALGYDVLGPARNGNDVVALGACFPIDLAIVDHRMPGKSGLEAALELFDIAPTPVLLLTGVATAELPDPLPEPPVVKVLTKPIELAQLKAAIEYAQERVQEWDDRDQGDPAFNRASRSDRATAARAVRAIAEDGRTAEAAARLFRQARDEGRSTAEVARSILRETAP